MLLEKILQIVLGSSEKGSYVASDIIAVIEATRDVVIMEDNQFAVMTPRDFDYYDQRRRSKLPANMKITYMLIGTSM